MDLWGYDSRVASLAGYEKPDLGVTCVTTHSEPNPQLLGHPPCNREIHPFCLLTVTLSPTLAGLLRSLYSSGRQQTDHKQQLSQIYSKKWLVSLRKISQDALVENEG